MDGNYLIDNIRNLCKKNKVSISKLETDLFLSPGLISRWNKSMPSLDKIADIADYFSVSIDELIGRSFNLPENNQLGRFLFLLYQQSIYGETTWEILNPLCLPKELFHVALPKSFTDGLCDSYYTGYQNGFFILTASHTSENGTQLSLYILPDVYSRFECVCPDTDRLRRLYEYLERRFRTPLNKIKAQNLMYTYNQENADISLPGNDKITPLHNIDEANTYKFSS